MSYQEWQKWPKDCVRSTEMVILLLAYFISNQFGMFITQGHYHKLCFVLADYAVD